jgi:hypothetical protein
MTKNEMLLIAMRALEDLCFEYGQLLDGDQDYGLLQSETNAHIIKGYHAKRLLESMLNDD